MAHQEHLEILFQGLEAWQTWRWEHPEIRPDLSDAWVTSNEVEHTPLSNKSVGAFLPCTNFSWANLQGVNLGSAELSSANFQQANLQGAHLSGAHLNRANLRGAILSGAMLFSANLAHADLSEADLSGAFLNKADLSGANLSGALLKGADLCGTLFSATTCQQTTLDEAIVGWTVFANVDLSSVRGLETIRHEGPSTLGIDTLFRSRGTLPRSFLFQAGMDHPLIELLQPQTAKSARIASCSPGYTLADQEVAMRLQASVQATGAPCWPVACDVPIGVPRPTLATAFFDRYDRLIPVLSKAALESEEVQREVGIALQMEEKRQQRVLFPLRIDDAVLTSTVEWVVQLRQGRPVIDFTRWQEKASYQRAFARLLQELR